MGRVRKRLTSASVFCFAAAVTACSESRTFTPASPSEISARLTEALNGPFINSQGLGAGRMTLLSEFTSYQGDVQPSIWVVDWNSASNSVKLTIHRRGDAPVLDDDGGFSGFPALDNCSVPTSGSPGVLIGAPLQPPLCPIVLSNVSSDKPKFLEIPTTLASGYYSVVVSNSGSGSETIRWTVLEN